MPTVDEIQTTLTQLSNEWDDVTKKIGALFSAQDRPSLTGKPMVFASESDLAEVDKLLKREQEIKDEFFKLAYALAEECKKRRHQS